MDTGKDGESVKEAVKELMERKHFPEQGYNACLGIISLENKYSAERLNSACKRALSYHSCSYHSIKRILEKNLDLTEAKIADKEKIHHDNIRGKDYYNLNLFTN